MDIVPIVENLARRSGTQCRIIFDADMWATNEGVLKVHPVCRNEFFKAAPIGGRVDYFNAHTLKRTTVSPVLIQIIWPKRNMKSRIVKCTYEMIHRAGAGVSIPLRNIVIDEKYMWLESRPVARQKNVLANLRSARNGACFSNAMQVGARLRPGEQFYLLPHHDYSFYPRSGSPPIAEGRSF
jgi:hypothetical protein